MPRKPDNSLGTVFEIKLAGLYYYGDYLGKRKFEGDVVRIAKTGYAKRPQLNIGDKLSALGEEVIYCTPLKVLLAAKCVRKMPDMKFSDRPKVPVVWRRMGGFTLEGKILSWVIEEKERDVAIVKHLNKKQQKLPESAITGRDILFFEISSGAVDADETPPVPAGSKGKKQKIVAIRHYLYFRRKADAQKAAHEIGPDCGEVTCRRSGQGTDWLVLVENKKPTKKTGADKAQERLEEIAETFGGEYDGSENELG